MTIHKAQGLTLNRIILNPKTFVTGQAYVVLSRVRCLKNIILTRKLREDDILVDYSTVKYILQTKVVVADPEHVEIVWKFKDEVRYFIGI